MKSYLAWVVGAEFIDDLVRDEVVNSGLSVLQQKGSVIQVEGDLSQIYQFLLWSRVASTLIVQLQESKIEHLHQLYDLCQQVPWQEHMRANSTFKVRFSGQLEGLDDSRFGALKVKDAIADYFRERTGERPSVAKDSPDLVVDVRVRGPYLYIGLDLAGEGLHRRGYRIQGGPAPLKETLAAAMLIRAQWPTLAKQGWSLMDPFCGSGTLLTEAALMASDTAPGFFRHYWGFNAWLQHDVAVWADLLQQARERRQIGMQQPSAIHGRDQNLGAVIASKRHLLAVGVKDPQLAESEVADWQQPLLENCLVITNPPYGERLGQQTELMSVYQQLGEAAHRQAPAGRLVVLSSDMQLLKQIPCAPKKLHRLRNGALEVFLQHYDLQSDIRTPSVLAQGADDFANRLRKNWQKGQKEAKRVPTTAWRVYDADLPDYSLAVDYYAGQVHVQEYSAPKTIDANKAEQRFQMAVNRIAEVLQVSAVDIHIKQRQRQKGTQQYQRQDDCQVEVLVQEGPVQVICNLSDYLDTGLFLDHRSTRLWMAKQKPATFLNLFAYTATASLHAAFAGAKTTSVDLSATYLHWAKRNFRLNQLPIHHHEFIQADVLHWLEQLPMSEKYHMIFLDPPTFSNSKRMEEVLDIQRDHQALIEKAMKHLLPGGRLVFSTNYRRFKLAPELSERYQVLALGDKSKDFDFKRNAKIHQCWHLWQ